ncbi:MAG TPA: hypothetical protein VGK33_06575, partial [Chloroflexota bacterium]
MRLPRHDTLLSLPAEPPAAGLTADEALLHRVLPALRSESAERSDRASRLWVAAAPAVVVGVGLHHRLGTIVDIARCERDGVRVLKRSAGGGALLLNPQNMLCGAVALPIAAVDPDVTESYRWLADLLLAALAIPEARRVEVDEARRDVTTLRQPTDTVHQALLTTCYGALSP